MRPKLVIGLATVAALVSLNLANLHGAVAKAPAPDPAVPQPTTSLKLNPPGFDTKYPAASVAVKVVVPRGVSWTATPRDPWVHVDQSRGVGPTNVTVRVDENPLIAGDATPRRESRVTFTAGDNLVVFPIVQSAHETYLAVSPIDVAATGGSQSQTFTFDTLGTAVGFDCPDISSSDRWVTVSDSTFDSATGAGSFTLSLKSNPLGLDRKATIIVNCAHGSQSIKIKQPAVPTLLLTPMLWLPGSSGATTSVRLTVFGSAKDVPVTSWTAVVTRGADWLSVSPQAGPLGAAATLTAAANPGSLRQGVVHFTYGLSEIDFTVSQKGSPVTPQGDPVVTQPLDTNALLSLLADILKQVSLNLHR